MKRIISILLAALVLLAAVPAFAEGEDTLQPGLYIVEDGTDVLYLDERGGGVLNYSNGEQDMANGVLWTGTSLEIERETVPFAMMGHTIVFTYDGAVRMLRYAGEGDDYAMGDGEDTAFAGTYLAEDGRKLVLAADGQGVLTDADGESTVFWGSLLPYWPGMDTVTANTCYVLFGSYLSGAVFADDAVTVSFEGEGDVVLQRQAAAQPIGEGQLYYGYQMTTDGQTIELIPFLTAMGIDPREICLEMRPDGTGHIQIMDEDSSADFVWTEDTFSVDGQSVPYTWVGDHILLDVEGESIEFAPAAEVEALLGGTEPEDTTVEPIPDETDGLVGTWTFTKARAMGIEIPASSMGTTMSLELKADGKATLYSGDSPIDLDWAVKEDGSISLSAVGAEIFTLTYDGTALTLITEGDSVEMVFEKDA